jgi:hypothetical protein
MIIVLYISAGCIWWMINSFIYISICEKLSIKFMILRLPCCMMTWHIGLLTILFVIFSPIQRHDAIMIYGNMTEKIERVFDNIYVQLGLIKDDERLL